MDMDLVIEAARAAAYINGISDPYGARMFDHVTDGGLAVADAEAEASNREAWLEVVAAVLAAAER